MPTTTSAGLLLKDAGPSGACLLAFAVAERRRHVCGKACRDLGRCLGGQQRCVCIILQRTRHLAAVTPLRALIQRWQLCVERRMCGRAVLVPVARRAIGRAAILLRGQAAERALLCQAACQPLRQRVGEANVLSRVSWVCAPLQLLCEGQPEGGAVRCQLERREGVEARYLPQRALLRRLLARGQHAPLLHAHLAHGLRTHDASC